MAKQKHIDLIDLLKGFAILSVIWLHSSFSAEVSKAVLAPFLFNLAVPIFMIVSGFTYSFSLSKYDDSKSVLKSYYSFNNLYKKLIRILPCYFIIFIIEIITEPMEFTGMKSITDFFYYLFTGGYVFPGSYYIPVLIQLILIFPLLKLLYNKLKSAAFIPVAVFQLIYEILIYYTNFPKQFSRLLIVRYLVPILGGIFIFGKYKNKKQIKNKWIYVISAILGAGYIIAIGYFDFTPKILFTDWATTAMPTALYLVPVIMLVLFKFGEKEVKPIFTILGKASYHIFLMQILYFGIVIHRINILNPSVNFIIAALFSVPLGLIMYFAENLITKMIKNKRSKSV